MIITKFLMSTEHGKRVKAFTFASAKCVIISWDDSLRDEVNHRRAAEAFAVKHELAGDWQLAGQSAACNGFTYTRRRPVLFVVKDPRA